jgi:hypothetical protein
MTMTSEFVTDCESFAAKYPIAVNEGAINGVKPAAGAGNSQHLAAANYIFDWTMQPFAGSTSEALLTVHAGPPQPGRERGFFLPWEADASISFDINNAVDWCFTSTLTGCTVRVYPLGSGKLRITHANARGAYNRVFTVTSTQQSVDRWQLQQADRMATATALGTIGGMLGPERTDQKMVTKRDYAAHVTDVHLKIARQRYQPQPGERVKTMVAAETSGKPEVSCFVWGHRDATGWRFWYQSTVQIVGQVERGTFHKKTRRIYGNSVVLGHPDLFYP